MGLAGQLTIQNARFHSIMEKFHDDPSDRFRELFEAVDHLDRISDGIRRGVMDVRMVPIGPLLNRYHRVVRDLTRSSGKLARLEILGEKTELDKRMIDELSDPLLQIVRNALDHGIEQPEVRVERRQAAGRPAFDPCLPSRQQHPDPGERRRGRPGPRPHPAKAWKKASSRRRRPTP